MSLYGIRQLADGMRAVRENTIGIAGDIPESQYGFRATPATRSVAETLVHIAWLWTSDHLIHEELRLESVEGFDFPALMAKSASEEAIARSKAEIIEMLRVEGARAVQWVESLPDAFVSERPRYFSSPTAFSSVRKRGSACSERNVGSIPRYPTYMSVPTARSSQSSARPASPSPA